MKPFQGGITIVALPEASVQLARRMTGLGLSVRM
jgi:hypothetical protein